MATDVLFSGDWHTASRPLRPWWNAIPRSVVYVCSVAFPTVLTALILAVSAWPKPYSYQYVAVIAVIAGIGGLFPGLIATALAATAIEVIWHAQPPLGLLMFVLAGLVLSYAGERARKAERDRYSLLASLQATVADADASRAKLEAVFQAMRAGVIVFDMQGNAVLVNDAQARILGCPTAESMKRDIGYFASLLELREPDGTLVPLEDWPVSRVMRGTSLRDCELLGRRPDTGQEWVFSYSGSPVHDESGRQVLAVIITRDVTQARRAEEEAEAHRRLLGTVVDDLPVGVVLLGGRDLRIHLANPAYRAIAPGKEMLGKTIDEVWAEIQSDVGDVCRDVLETGIPCHVIDAPLRIRRAPAAPLELAYFSTSVYRVRLAGEAGWGIVRTVLETTERKQTEEALREANTRLQEADRRKDEFLAVLSHELRNPLAAMRFALSLLKTAGAQHERERDVIERQLLHLVRLVDDLLDVSRITRNKIRLRREQLNVRTLVDAALESIEPQVRAAGHRLVVQNDEDLTIDADATRILQVLTNLLNNAVKFTPPGGQLVVTTHATADHAVVQVRDSGVGIAPEALPRIFEMFHQADSGFEPGVGGLGIGLTLSKQLVGLHGGTLDAMSEGVNRGAEFVIRLPLAANVPAESPVPTPPEPKVPAPRLRVLIVEDSVDNAEMLNIFVSGLGHEVRVAHNGFTALSTFAAFRPDVVLLDIGLPGMSGYDVALELRRRSDHSLYLVAITGWGQDEDRRRAREAGFDRHITKPADPEVLEEILAAQSLSNAAPATRRADVANPGRANAS